MRALPIIWKRTRTYVPKPHARRHGEGQFPHASLLGEPFCPLAPATTRAGAELEQGLQITHVKRFIHDGSMTQAI
eukprot:COSAG05_NODE_792_length_7316_cov_31.215325_6_plen_75_part_00